MQDIFSKLWDRPGLGLLRETVEDWNERSLDADSLEPWQISKLLHLSFPGQPFPGGLFSFGRGGIRSLQTSLKKTAAQVPDGASGLVNIVHASLLLQSGFQRCSHEPGAGLVLAKIK